MTTYQVTFRVGGIDATDQHRTATVEAADERGALDAAAARLWGKPGGSPRAPSSTGGSGGTRRSMAGRAGAGTR